MERTNLSLSSHWGLAGSWLRLRKYRTAIRSAADRDPPGCPEPAAVVISTTWILSLLAISSSSATLMSFMSLALDPWCQEVVHPGVSVGQ